MTKLCLTFISLPTNLFCDAVPAKKRDRTLEKKRPREMFYFPIIKNHFYSLNLHILLAFILVKEILMLLC